MRRIYLDANATTPLLPEVLEAMRPFLLEQFGNASSIHQEGQHARAAVEQARASVARLLGCRPAEIVFTSGGTESDNLAIFGSVKPGDHVITSAVEHHAVLHAVEKTARSRGRGRLPAGQWPGSRGGRGCTQGIAAQHQVDQRDDGQQ